MPKNFEYDEATLAFYSEVAPIYQATGKGGTNRYLDRFMSMLPKDACILDLGCGGGLDSEAMLSNGFKVESWDASEKIAVQAEIRLRRKVFIKRFDELDAVNDFSAIWASASLLHVPMDTLPAILRRIYSALKQNGVHFASYKTGGSEGRDSVGRYFNFPSKEQLMDAYHQSGQWHLQEIYEYEGGGYENGKSGPWIAVILIKR